MVVTMTELDEALGQILAKASEVEVKNIIGTYDQSKSADENIKLLCSTFQREPLKNACTFLKTISAEYPAQAQNINAKSRNKEEFARDIITFLDFLKPTLCLKCNTNYVPTRDDHSDEKLKCHNCRRPSHSDCYIDHEDNSKIGIIYFCGECMSAKTANALTESLRLHQEQQLTETPKPQVNETCKPAEKKPEEKGEEEVEQNENASDCPLYLKRICPHGLTGRREVNGKSCPLKHRKLCFYFARNGPSGCHFKKRCKYLHPTVCQNSLKIKVCLNDACQEFHFKGTQRIARDNTILNKPATNPSQIRDQPRMSPWSEDTVNSQQVPSNYNPWSQNTSTSHKQPLNTNPTKNFLEEFLQEMKADLKSFTTTMIQQTIQTSLPQLVNQTKFNLQNGSQQETAQKPQQETPNSLPQAQQTYYSQLYNQNFPQFPQQQLIPAK